jgi:hypothetical protein
MLEHRALLYDSDEEFVGVAGPVLADGARAPWVRIVGEVILGPADA